MHCIFRDPTFSCSDAIFLHRLHAYIHSLRAQIYIVQKIVRMNLRRFYIFVTGVGESLKYFKCSRREKGEWEQREGKEGEEAAGEVRGSDERGGEGWPGEMGKRREGMCKVAENRSFWPI